MTEGPSIHDQLASERLAVQQRLAALQRDFDDIVGSPEGTDDEHDPEGATVAFERQHVAALLAQARDQLTRVDAALARLADGSYGRCEHCGQPIAPERLAARPTATTCIGCASKTR
jgi:DnaK suppressor protein